MTALSTTPPAGNATPAPRLEIEVRPGVAFPDWSAIQSETVETALGAIFEAFGIEKCWTGYGGPEDGLRRAVLEHYRDAGSAPSVEWLCRHADLAEDQVLALLRGLAGRDLVVLDAAGTAITGAYPFTERATEHRVRLGTSRVHAMCAIDALGAGAMYGQDVSIDSSCRARAAPIHVETRDQGRALESFSPRGAVVWSGIEPALGCAATSLCPVIAFFCSDACLATWRDAEHPGVDGFRLSMDEGRQAGAAIFTPMLAPAVASPERRFP